MKRALLIPIVALTLTIEGFAQESEKLFAMIYSKGEGWNEALSTTEQTYFKEHSMHLQSLRKEDKIVIGGRYSDVGFMILKASDMAEAESITQRDSSVVAGTFKVELYEFSTFYTGCVGQLKEE